MSKKASEAALAKLHELLAEAFTGIIRDGVTVMDRQGEAVTVTAPAAYLKEAREFLKDNNVDAIPQANPALQNLASVLPFPAPGEDEGYKVG